MPKKLNYSQLAKLEHLERLDQWRPPARQCPTCGTWHRRTNECPYCYAKVAA